MKTFGGMCALQMKVYLRLYSKPFMHYGFWSVYPSAGQKTFPAMVHVQTVCEDTALTMLSWMNDVLTALVQYAAVKW